MALLSLYRMLFTGHARETSPYLVFRGKVSRNTLTEASEKRDWRIYSYFAQILIHEARQSYADDDFRLELQEAVYALDATITGLCLSVFSLVWFRKTKNAIRLHALLDQEATPPLLYG